MKLIENFLNKNLYQIKKETRKSSNFHKNDFVPLNH